MVSAADGHQVAGSPPSDPPVGSHAPPQEGRIAALERARVGAAHARPERGAVALLLLAATVLIAWPVSDVPLEPGLAISWRVALHEAAGRGMAFGPDVLFTYGPLGYLAVARFFGAATGSAAVFATFAMSAALLVTSAAILGSRSTLAITVVAVVAVARLSAIVDPMIAPVIMVLGFVSYLAHRPAVGPGAALALVGLGVVCGITMLVKFNAGVTILGIVGVTFVTLVLQRSRYAPIVLLSTLISIVVCWLAAGQDVAALTGFLSGSWDLASGYSAAMSLPVEPWQIIAALLVAGLLLGTAYRSSAGLARYARARLILSVAVVAFFAWKHGVVRQGLDGFFVEAILIGLIAIDWRRVSRPLTALALAAPLVFFLASSPRPISLLEAGRSIDVAADQIVTATAPGAAAARTRQVREQLRGAYDLPSSIVAAIAGRSTHIEGWETAVAFAYPEMDWRPAPIFQAYAIFTASLDATNDTFLRGKDAPERILRHRPRSIDGRQWRYDGPSATLAMFCNYYEVASTVGWQVLGRGPDRCGREVVVGEVQALEGEPVAVPAIGDSASLLAVRIAGLSGIAESVRTVIFQGSTWSIALDGRTYRLVPGTATGPLLIGSTTDLGYRYGFGMGNDVRSVSVATESNPAPRMLTFTFVRIPVSAETASLAD